MSFHKLDFRGFLISFSFINSELSGALFSGHSVNFITFGNFYNKNIFFNKKSVLAIKNISPPPPPIIFL